VPQRQSVRQARASISKTLASGKTVAIGNQYRELRGFIVGVPPHNEHSRDERRKALKQAKASFTAAWIAESQQA